MPDDAPAKKRRYGPKPKPAHEQRRHPISCRVNDAEIAIIDQRRGKVSRGEWLRLAALSKPPRIVPEVNKVAWAELSRAAGNLNQLARAINEGRWPVKDAPGAKATLMELRAHLDAVRASLIGLDGES